MADAPTFITRFTNLADPQVGAAVLFVSDEFFAPAKRMLDAAEPVFLADRYDAHGKWMDGWESRRRRDEGHDQCVIRICPGRVRGIDIDTRYFIGNYPDSASLEACRVDGDPDRLCTWTELVPRSPLSPDSHHWFEIDSEDTWTHLRLNIYPDGGVARLRVHGEPASAMEPGSDLMDLIGRDCGGRAVYCNDMHFGHMDNLLAPSPSMSMADGWETRRRRTPGNDFVLLQLGRPGIIQRVEIDTAHFLGNHPAQASLCAAMVDGEPDPEQSADWPCLLDRSALGPDQLHVFDRQIRHTARPVSHVRLDIYPDGGVARLRVFGRPVTASGDD